MSIRLAFVHVNTITSPGHGPGPGPGETTEPVSSEGWEQHTCARVRGRAQLTCRRDSRVRQVCPEMLACHFSVAI